jgi:hypothetical protein
MNSIVPLLAVTWCRTSEEDEMKAAELELRCLMLLLEVPRPGNWNLRDKKRTCAFTISSESSEDLSSYSHWPTQLLP